MLSKGGGDTVVVREYDFGKKKFIAPKKGGFYLPEAKSRYCWENEDTILVATDFGEGSLTDSGYPRVLKRVKRGQSLDEAERDPGLRLEACVRRVRPFDAYEYEWYKSLSRSPAPRPLAAFLSLMVRHARIG